VSIKSTFDVNRVIRNLVTDYLGIMSIVADQNAPLPTDDMFCSVKVTALSETGEPDISTRLSGSDDLIQEINNRRLYTCSINFYKRPACKDKSVNDYAVEFQMRMSSDVFIGVLASKEMGLITQSIIRDLTRTERGQFEERCQFDIILNVLQSIEAKVPKIKEISIDGTVEESAKKYKVETKIIN